MPELIFVPPQALIFEKIEFKTYLFCFVILNNGLQRVAEDSNYIKENLSFSPSKSIMYFRVYLTNFNFSPSIEPLVSITQTISIPGLNSFVFSSEFSIEEVFKDTNIGKI